MRFVILVLTVLFLSGCSSFGLKMKEWISGKPAVEAQRKPASTPVTFSQKNQAGVLKQRNYQRMTREKMEQEAQLSPKAGSLWVMEGQGAYLFAQNTARMVGDLLNVNIDGQPETQLVTKVTVIKDLLAKLERQAEARRLASLPASQQQQDQSAQQPTAETGGGSAGADPEFQVKVVPTRIVELLKDGNYRVKGDQPFMIGKREYKVIVTGIVRPADFDDAGISAEKLLDPKFDIVSLKRPGAG